MKIGLLLRTIKHIRLKQLYYQLINRFSTVKEYKGEIPKSTNIQFVDFVHSHESLIGNNNFAFLNLKKEFKEIDWNFGDYGKLWTYNLNYFDFLLQKGIPTHQGEELIKDFIKKYDTHKDAKEPYPISLRAINWIKYFQRNEIQNKNYDTTLYIDLRRLYNRVENHLLGNHLLENGFALLFGAYYFRDEGFYSKAKKILLEELEEQILKDGAHFELSPMYHCILLERVLDCYQLVKLNKWKEDDLETILLLKAQEMLGWLHQITFNDGSYPLFNDSTSGIAKEPFQLFDYSNKLGVEAQQELLGDSGYRKWEIGNNEIFMDIGKIGPDYIPGHAHADTFNFVLKSSGNDIVIDPGISTYEKNNQRNLERSTLMHNTVTISEANSSEVWGGFRVGRRANVKLLSESSTSIKAKHNGFRYIKAQHTREFLKNDDSFEIVDLLNKVGEAHFILGSSCKIKVNNEKEYLLEDVKLTFEGEVINVQVNEIKIPNGYNRYLKTNKLTVKFNKELKAKFTFNEDIISNG